jgi:uncharacterized protein (TIGR00369 family)
MLLEPCKDNYCFGCGGANPQGLQLSFEQDDAARRIRAVFRLRPEYQGARGFLHGGIIATLLDEIMAKLSRLEGNGTSVTAELKVEYLKPVPVDADLHAEAYEASRAGRNLFRVGEIRNSEGVLLARGNARFVQIDRSRSREKLETADAPAANEL